MNTVRIRLRPYVILLALAGTAAAQPSTISKSTAPRAPLDAVAVEAFVDRVMADSMARTYAPGAVVTVVEGDRLILAKGYGVANVETRAPIDPAHTLFRIASITKLFTTATALRLEEQGRLDLDTDVNRYLTRVKVPDTFPEPVTARRLMTHHGGFDTAVTYMDFPNEKAAEQSPTQMSWDIRRARPVTALPLYDNMGFGVLGLVVADILHTSYRDAVRQEIFVPLGMDQSVSGLPDNRVADAAHAHMRDAHWHAALIPHNVMPTSAQGGGDISSTAVDMGKFLSAMLVPGKLLQPATLAKMTNFDTWRFHPRVPGLGLALWQYSYHGHAAEGHRGEVNGFISRVALFRDNNIGIFVSVDSTVQPWPQPRLSEVLTNPPSPRPPAGARTLDPDPLIDGLLEQFADHFLSPPPAPRNPGPLTANEPTVEQLAGDYFRRDASTHLMARMLATISAPRLEALPNGEFSLLGCRPFVRKDPLYYQCGDPKDETLSLGFRVVDGNRIFASLEPVGAQERQPWWLTTPFTLFLVALLLELQFGYDLAHSELHRWPTLWRVFFPVAAVLLLASAALTLPALRSAPEKGASAGPFRIGYHLALALGSVGLVWLICVWGLAWPFH
jgi:CubicO group peptidase (beta-lactamase class C family)